MFAFIAISVIASIALAYLAVRNLGNDAVFTPRSLLVGMVLSVVAVAGIGKSLEINQLSIASVMLTAMALTVITVIVHARSLRPQLVPVPVKARRRQR